MDWTQHYEGDVGQVKIFWLVQGNCDESHKLIEKSIISRRMTDDDDDDDNDDNYDGLHMISQSTSTDVLLGKDVSKPGAAREGSYRFGDYEVLNGHLSGEEFAQFGSYARTARGEVLIVLPFSCFISMNLHVYRLVCLDILIDYILIHAHHVQERLSTYANVAIRLKRFIRS